MYALDKTHTDLFYFWKNFFFWNFLRDVCHTAIDAEALWKCRPTKPISSKVPYYMLCFSSSSTSCCEYCVTRGNTWIIAASTKWSGRMEWGPSGKVGHQRPCSPDHYAKKLHISYAARARAARRAIYYNKTRNTKNTPSWAFWKLPSKLEVDAAGNIFELGGWECSRLCR